MSRWIEAEPLIEAIGEEPYVWNDEADEIAERNQWLTDMNIIYDAPSIDLVRCGECKCWRNIGYIETRNMGDIARAVYDLILQVQMLKMADRKTEPQTDYRITGTIGYRCPKCGRGNFLNNESNCVYCGEPLIKDEPQTESSTNDGKVQLTDCARKKGE